MATEASHDTGPEGQGTIVVGVDGSPGSVAALRWALAEARLRGARLRVVHAFPHPRLPATEAGLGAAGGMGIPAVYVEEPEKLRQAVEAEARHVIDETLRAAGGAAASEGVPVETVAREGPAAQTLIDAGREAELLVVGSRGRGGFVGLVLGSVSQQCAQHPPCPVVILPPERPEGDAAA